MKVKELIEELQKLPEYATVRVLKKDEKEVHFFTKDQQLKLFCNLLTMMTITLKDTLILNKQDKQGV